MKQENQNKTQNGKEGAKFHSKKVKHDHQAESARAVFGLHDSENSG